MMSPEPLFLELEAYLHKSREQLAKGEDFSLEGLDKKITRLCDCVAALPGQDERLSYAEKLRKLLAELNALGKEIFHQNTKELPRHQSANVAYKKADSRDNFGKENKN